MNNEDRERLRQITLAQRELYLAKLALINEPRRRRAKRRCPKAVQIVKLQKRLAQARKA